MLKKRGTPHPQLTRDVLVLFRCSKCPAEFTRQKSYLLHQRNVHHCDRNFQCETCGRAFLFETNLIRHQQVSWISQKQYY